MADSTALAPYAPPAAMLREHGVNQRIPAGKATASEIRDAVGVTADELADARAILDRIE